MDESRLQKLEQRLEELDRRSTAMERAMDKAMDRSRQAVEMIVPHEARKHLRAAGREQLLAVRSLLGCCARGSLSTPLRANTCAPQGASNCWPFAACSISGSTRWATPPTRQTRLPTSGRTSRSTSPIRMSRSP